MASSVTSFQASDLTANRQGRLSDRQRERLADYIQEQGVMFVWHTVVIGGFGLAITALLMMATTGRVPVMNNDRLVVLSLIITASGFIVLPYSMGQAMVNYRVLQQYRDNRVDVITGICRWHAASTDGMLYTLTFNDRAQPNFLIDQADAQQLQDALASGSAYRVYYFNDVLLSFEASTEPTTAPYGEVA